ncbi:MAG: phosphoribosylamine--glycine ligase [Nitrospirae bacterium]|nr:phosphoribosylamine--glycine ligase [Nitrospirota bacterium]
MKILVIGSGGREHALVWKLARSPRVEALYCAPGNPGMGRNARCVPIKTDDLDELLEFAKRKAVDLTVVGPELPLTMGIVDRFKEAGLRIIGPSRGAAEVEASKAFSKSFMERHHIPTAHARIFDEPEPAIRYIKEHGAPIVVKVDGLAAGKGVIMAQDETEAILAVDLILRRKQFGEAGSRLLLEDLLDGEEATFLVFTDGKTVIPMVTSQDHKRVYDQDQGPNTGGMGAYSPAPVLTEALQLQVLREIVRPTVDGLAREGRPFQGILYVGLMLTTDGPKVLEYNARFGDPETQVILTRLETDLVDILEALESCRLDQIEVLWSPKVSVCVVLTAKGYPATYESGRPITGIDQAESKEGVVVFHAGTFLRDGELVTAGGRVLGVTAVGDDFQQARDRAYEAVSRIRFEGMHCRMDIALKGLTMKKGLR